MTDFDYGQHRDVVREVIAGLLRDKYGVGFDAVQIAPEELPDEAFTDIDDDEYDQFLEGLAEYVYEQVDQAEITVEWPSE